MTAFFHPSNTFAAEKTETPVAASATPAPEEADVQKVKEKYWARGNETELGVVQNRYYSKSHNVELGVYFGTLNGDPFLSNKSYGGSIGYHISEFFAVQAIGWSASVSPSSALEALKAQTNTTANTNPVKNYLGAEARASLLYGKLSLVGKAILYFDAYFSAGGGRIATDSGNNAAVTAGIGQQIHLSQLLSFNIDYKLLWYKEKIVGKATTNLGRDLGTQSNVSHLITVGFSVLL